MNEEYSIEIPLVAGRVMLCLKETDRNPIKRNDNGDYIFSYSDWLHRVKDENLIIAEKRATKI